MADLKIPVSFQPDEATARVCMAIVESFMNGHPDYDIRTTEREDGTLRIKLVMKCEPCRD